MVLHTLSDLQLESIAAKAHKLAITRNISSALVVSWVFMGLIPRPVLMPS